MTGKVIIFSAPSGAGKSTVVGHLLKLHPEFEFSVSATSRPPRGEEKDGEAYYFISAERFRELIALDSFVEYEEVYHDRFYGTLKSEVERIWEKGHVIIFDVDVKGGVSLKKYFGDAALSICISLASKCSKSVSGAAAPTARRRYANASQKQNGNFSMPRAGSTASSSTTSSKTLSGRRRKWSMPSSRPLPYVTILL